MMITALLGDYPGTREMKDGLGFGAECSFLPGRPVKHFRAFIERLHIHIAEAPIMTVLMAHERAVPLALLPVVVLGGTQHRFLYSLTDGPIRHPRDLVGKRIGVRAYTVTTVVWLRDILEQDYGIARDAITWVVFEPPHVDGFVNPDNVVQAPPGANAEDMLRDGLLDAAILRADPVGDDVSPVIKAYEQAGDAWRQKHDALQINHVMTVPRAFAQQRPDLVAQFMQGLESSVARAEETPGEETLIGRDAVDRSLELAVACARRQGIITATPDLEELYRGNGLM
ncbi:hypothetical protein [Poseidonocella sedimentorum]|uniref:4,5-dihydroxyphthalate decarboxylase n=1 Tax=Poseidonocella sedimentorum TaxID=871652 RepID=A0A1I6D7E5_9RHOB|nr:hypothetical protein [Poseidonocella sedimentorum]SFR01416.1 4,5-dihydroxyphthalate decarboxylase [Poseidonocella sedimentorum]